MSFRRYADIIIDNCQKAKYPCSCLIMKKKQLAVFKNKLLAIYRPLNTTFQENLKKKNTFSNLC